MSIMGEKKTQTCVIYRFYLFDFSIIKYFKVCWSYIKASIYWHNLFIRTDLWVK